MVDFELSFELVDLDAVWLKLFLFVSHNLKEIVEISLEVFFAEMIGSDLVYVVEVGGFALVVPVEVRN